MEKWIFDRGIMTLDQRLKKPSVSQSIWAVFQAWWRANSFALGIQLGTAARRT
jgi:hypothetical protein